MRKDDKCNANVLLFQLVDLDWPKSLDPEPMSEDTKEQIICEGNWMEKENINKYYYLLKNELKLFLIVLSYWILPINDTMKGKWRQKLFYGKMVKLLIQAILI